MKLRTLYSVIKILAALLLGFALCEANQELAAFCHSNPNSAHCVD